MTIFNYCDRILELQHMLECRTFCIPHVAQLKSRLTNTEFTSMSSLHRFQCAFDCVNHGAMWLSLSKYGVPDKLIDSIKELYRDANICVLHQGMIGEGFDVKSGVKQGYFLFPLQFNIMLDFVMRCVNRTKRAIQWDPFNRLSDLDYADDIVALTHMIEDLKFFLDDLVKCASVVGLNINVGKTKLMFINPQKLTRNTINHLEIDSELIEEVGKFAYLGALFRKMLLSGCETWRVTKSLLNQQGFKFSLINVLDVSVEYSTGMPLATRFF